MMLQEDVLNLITCARNEGWQDLDLSGRGLTEIPEALTNLTELRNLQLCNNLIKIIPESISNLKNLERLDLGNNQIEEIPDSFIQLKTLKLLYLHNNKIQNIPEAINRLTNLLVLNLSENQIATIPETIEDLPKLEELDLRGNLFPIPHRILENSIRSVKNLLNYLRALRLIDRARDAGWQTLNLSEMGLTEIPESIANLSKLKHLSLYNNQIQEITEVITDLSSLEILDLRNNKIREIPDSLSNLTNLTLLNLSSNQISKIPDSFGKLTNLIELYLFKNRIQRIPEIISNLSNLQVLALQNNQIRRIPKKLFKLVNLSSLSIADNQIEKIPPEITRLTKLKKLVLYGNKIIKIPPGIGNLINLKTLFLNNNLITDIPEEIGNLSNLVELYLNNNLIESVPDKIGELSSTLKKLDLRENPLSISLDILGLQDLQKIVPYLEQLRSGVRPLHEAKLLLVGEGSVGKTSLIQRLLHGRFQMDERITEGINVEQWQVQVGKAEINLNVWDFGGQEIYHATHQFFLTKRSLYLLVYNCRTSEDENRIEYWLKLIESFGDNSPVIIVGNKKDERPLDLNQKSLREKYPNIKAILQTSCLQNEGIDELRDAILKQLANLKEIYDLLPISWFEVKHQLESMPDDFITYNQYIGICHDHKISEDKNQEQLIDLLHRLGVVLNFREHPMLQRDNILNPKWVTTGIYAILSDEVIKTTNKGIFSLTDDLTKCILLDPLRYPLSRHKYLVGMMQQFNLCFALGDKSDKFLIPALLPKDEPDDTKLEGATLEFQFHYPILPEVIISRFIVLIHDKIHNQTYWRSGVMLEYTEDKKIYNIASIKAETNDKKIIISINGHKRSRRIFLGIIRSTFQKIHDLFANLEITERVPVPNHPNYPPLDYQELLAHEAMGKNIYTVGKLGLDIDLHELLDGYEDIKSRQEKQRNDREQGIIEREHVAIHIYNSNIQEPIKPMPEITNNLQGANIANFANEVKDNARQQANQHIHQDSHQNLTQAAKDIKDLLDQLDKDYDRNTPTGQTMISAKAIESIENNPSLKDRLFKAIEEGGSAALEQLVDHPAIKILVATYKGFANPK